MTNEKPFFQDIVDNYDDDAPRLICADWLEENGCVERAEFIRLQCQLAQIQEGDEQYQVPAHQRPYRIEHRMIKEREYKLLAAHEEEWTGEIRRIVTRYSFSRGFVDTVRIEDFQRFSKGVSRLFQLAPIINLIFFPRTDVADGGLTLLANSPSLSNVISLDLREQGIGRWGVDALAQSANLERLRRVNLRHNSVDFQGAKRLLGATCLKDLRNVDLRNNVIEEPEAIALRKQFGVKVLV